MEKREVMRMETGRSLTELFDRQRFERDPALQRVIDEVEERYFGEALSDEQLQAVTAAGEPCLLAHPPREQDGTP